MQEAKALPSLLSRLMLAVNRFSKLLSSGFAKYTKQQPMLCGDTVLQVVIFKYPLLIKTQTRTWQASVQPLNPILQYIIQI